MLQSLELATIRQPVPTAPLADPAAAVRAELTRIGMFDQLRRGAYIAIDAGSRGIHGYATVVGAVVAELLRVGARPFIFPAMGSHGGATDEGQREMLATWGITEATMGCSIISSMEARVIGFTDSGMPVYCDAAAFASDGILVVNRVKEHTDFHGPTESGLTKMLAIGIGKRQGAEQIHARGVYGLREDIPRVAQVLISNAPVLAGIAIVEDGSHAISEIRAVPAHAIAAEEPYILERARRLAARLPIDHCDLLIVDRIGKDISGTGMDTNVIGRIAIDGQPEPERPRITALAALRLTADSHGNATGLGFADAISKPLFDAMDAEVTQVNVVTSGFPRRGIVPPVYPDDRATIAAALALSGVAHQNARIVRIRDTLSLHEIQVSTALLPELLAHPEVELVADATPLVFDENGMLTIA
ncbi:MAG TPA: DUF2088 domain-containing protein [Roseiflexaceae bacterium]|nr:DUF2088 domain-containing protein [Roseiflexaceae bacterium]